MSLFNQDTIQRLDKRIASKIDDGDLVVELSDETYLYPSGGKYERTDLIGDGDTTFTVAENYEKSKFWGIKSGFSSQPLFWFFFVYIQFCYCMEA